ncbi:MAG: hypothetical protein HC838_13225 [Spirulinaceae cyanobacterium RM2_2_10]|nr:hypothetical protein [Spirulinaceae cyanobacterium SM2_1_0]NJO20805.1 hypothetical protein [Spirulinaceae cyanobacterium RM2_2_10]
MLIAEEACEIVLDVQLSETLYRLYGRMHRWEQLSSREIQTLKVLRAHRDRLNEEHQAMLQRINYRLNKPQRQTVVAC